MHHLGLALALLIAPATTLAADDHPPSAQQDELATINAVSAAWDRYAVLTSKDDEAGIALVSAAGLRHYAFLRDAALAASSDQIHRIPISDRVLVYLLRASQKEADLAALDGAGLGRLCMRKGWCGVAKPDEGESLPAVSHVTALSADHAITEMGPPTGTQYVFGPELLREDGQWKVSPQTTTLEESTQILQHAQRAGMAEADMSQHLVSTFLEEGEAPQIAALDRPLRDDAAARTRLNETWPDYVSTMKARWQALEHKAAAGDSLAQFGLGAMYYTGKPDGVVAQDKDRGVQLLEEASDNGHVLAAAAAAEALMSGYTPQKGKAPPASLVARVARHSKRAAEGGVPVAMAALGGMIFNGAGDMPRDCRLAEEWAARAEDAGIPHARNDRVWYLATCPIADQRAPQRALELAGHMIERRDSLPAAELDTVAAALAAGGRFAEAREFQNQALAKLGKDDEPTRKRMQKRLQAYIAGRAWVQDYNEYAIPFE